MADRVLAIAAHPDDIEFVMSGTMLLLQEVGWELHYFNIANGSCGTQELSVEQIVAKRRAEAMAAAQRMGATYHESLTADMEVLYRLPLVRRITAVVRSVAPAILLVHSPQDYMEDHMNACRLAVSAAFCRGMPNFQVDPPCPPVDEPVRIYHAQPHGNCDGLGNPIRPDFVVDVTDRIEQKRALLACHESQKAWLDASQGMDSYLLAMEELSREVGRFSGRFSFAEGWRRHSHLGYCAQSFDPLIESLPVERYHLLRTR